MGACFGHRHPEQGGTQRGNAGKRQEGRLVAGQHHNLAGKRPAQDPANRMEGAHSAIAPGLLGSAVSRTRGSRLP